MLNNCLFIFVWYKLLQMNVSCQKLSAKLARMLNWRYTQNSIMEGYVLKCVFFSWSIVTLKFCCTVLYNVCSKISDCLCTYKAQYCFVAYQLSLVSLRTGLDPWIYELFWTHDSNSAKFFRKHRLKDEHFVACVSFLLDILAS